MEEEKKPDLGGADDQSLTITLRNQEQAETKFKVKYHTPLLKVFAAYAKRQAQDLDSLRFVFDGAVMNKNQTPKDYDMEDGDAIDVMITQVGGTC